MVLRCQLNFSHFLWVKVFFHLLLKTHPSASKAGVFRDSRFLGDVEAWVTWGKLKNYESTFDTP